MRRLLGANGLFLALFLLGAIAAAEPPVLEKKGGGTLDRFSPEQKKKLFAGEAIFESVIGENAAGASQAHGRTCVLISKPISECYKIFCDFNNQYLYYPHMKVSKVLKTDGNKIIIYKELDYVVTTVRYTHVLTLDPARHRVDFDLDPTGVSDVKASAGYFMFEKVADNASLFTYELTKMDAGVKIPDFIKTYMSSKDLPEIALCLKKRIESGGTWKKEKSMQK
jgi:hypothetical protein